MDGFIIGSLICLICVLLFLNLKKSENKIFLKVRATISVVILTIIALLLFIVDIHTIEVGTSGEINRILTVSLLFLPFYVFFCYRIYVDRQAYQNIDNTPNTIPTYTSFCTPKPFPDIENMIQILQSKIGFPLNEHHVSRVSYMMDNLSYNAKNRGAITDLVDDILNYYGLESSKVLVKVLYEKIDEVCGTYSSNCETYGEIMIRIDPEISTYDSIVATAFHECAHYYMAIRKIRLQDVQENERLTDLTALYLGGDGYYKRNYDIKRFSNLQPGYLTYDELHYAIERICELRKEKEKKIHQLNLTNKASFEDAKSLSDKVIALEKQLCFDNVICEPETIQKVFHIYADLKEKSDSYFSVCSKTLYNSLPTISEINRIEAQKKEQKNKVESLYKELKKYVELIEEQKVYSPTVYDYLKNISRLAGEGNVFCLFEKLKFYCLSSKTMDDAKIIYEKIKHHGTADSLFVLGKCFDEGVYVAQDKEHARELFLLAAKDGSVDAQKKITMIEAF